MIRISYLIFTDSDIERPLSLAIAISWPVSVPGLMLYYCVMAYAHICMHGFSDKVKLPVARVLDNSRHRQ